MPKRRATNQVPSECPVCGADVPPKALACPACGADERTGWNAENTRYDGLDLPDETFDYDEALKEEDLKPRVIPRGIPAFWWVVGIGITIMITYYYLGASLWVLFSAAL